MFNFLCFIKDGETVALLTDGGYNVTFRANERRTSIVASAPLESGGDERRYSTMRHVHNEKHIGASAQDKVDWVL